MSILQPTTELEAVNTLLDYLGESPVNTLDSGVTEADQAQALIHEYSREIQTRGLSCNTEEDYTLLKNADGNIKLPANTLSVDCSVSGMKLTQRGSKLYDRKNHTYKFPDIDSIDVNLVIFLPFDELPEPVRRYITIKAARKFLSRTLGSSELSGLSKEDEQTAYLAVTDYEFDQQNFNIFNDIEKAQADRLSSVRNGVWV